MKTIYDLFCIPYAGASAVAVYSKWRRFFDSNIQLKPVELAGHAGRLSEPLDKNLEEVTDGIVTSMRSSITERPYAIYGHSMGTVISYELLKKIKRKGLPLPQVLFLSGRYPLHIKYEKFDLNNIRDDVFLERVMLLGGTPLEVFQTKELREFFLPILKNDYRLVEDYSFNGNIEVFDCDIEFFYSDDDQYTRDKDKVKEWKLYTGKGFRLHDFRGGHFFINEQTESICKIIRDKLEEISVKNL